MFKNAHSSSTVARNGTLSTPFASRSGMARISTDYPRSMHRTMASRQTYFSLSDPHLTHYFRNKLLAGLDRERSRSSMSFGRPQSSQSTPRRPRTAQAQVCYNINIRTGATPNSGTSSRTYITLEGSKGQIKRHRLSRGGKREFTFDPGSLERFKVRGKDIGELNRIKLENEGLKRSEAWFIETVSVINEEGRKWVCPCNKWLSLHHSDCQLARTLKAKPFRQNQTDKGDQNMTNYTIEVHTGNVRGAGTGANVFVTLMGTKNTSSKTLLKSDVDFERGSVATMELRCEDIGRLKTLQIEHDNSGFGPDWFLDKIVVYRSSNPERKVYFHCGQWLSRTEGDGAIQRTLQASKVPPKDCVGKTYLVATVTGNLRGAGTDANVFVTLYGSLGCSGEKRLDNDPANFERGRKDTFSIQCCELGELTKVRVRHDNTGAGPGWLLESVDVRCEESEGVWVFPCGEWLEMCDGCGGKLEVELTVVGETEAKKKDSDEATYHYTIQTVTGSRPGSSTNANVYLILHDRDNHSDKIWLDNGQRTFLSGQTDRFEVSTSKSFHLLEAITVGHDNSGPSPGWFLKQVCVTSHMTGSTPQVFQCDLWLCMDSGDGRIERELHPFDNDTSQQGPQCSDECKWTVHIWTSDIRGAGTDANVTLKVHGTDGDTPPIPLGDDIANFEQGEHDIFPGVVLPADIGQLDHVTLSHDNTNPYPDWHVDRIKLVNDITGGEYLAECGRWLSAMKGDGSTSVKLKLVQTQQSSSSTIKPSKRNHVNQEIQDIPSLVHNGTVKNGPTIDTNAKPSTDGVVDQDGDSYGDDEFESSISELSLSEGEDTVDGDSGRDRLDDLGVTRRRDMSSELDSSITNKYLQQLKFAQMSGSDESSRVPSLSLTFVSPEQSLNDTSTGNKMNRMMTMTSPRGRSGNTIPYTVHVAAGSPPATSPASFLVISMIGEHGSAPPVQLEPVGSCHGNSGEGKVETYSVEGVMVGHITSIKVRLNSPKSSVSWLIDEISIHSPTSGHTYYFPWGRGIQPGKEYSLERVEQLGSSLNTSTRASSPMASSGLVAYQVKVSTADKKQAGTNNSLHLILIGEQSVSKPFVIKNSTKDLKFQRGQIDTFQVATPTIGSLKAVKVAHCPRRSHKNVTTASNGDGEDSTKWYLFQLVLTRLTDHRKHYFLCRKWIKASVSHDKLEYTTLSLTKVE